MLNKFRYFGRLIDVIFIHLIMASSEALILPYWLYPTLSPAMLHRNIAGDSITMNKLIMNIDILRIPMFYLD
jgi:hypothetical protein